MSQESETSAARSLHRGEPAPNVATQFAESVALMQRLRGQDGCPWDREQTFSTLRRYTVEEVYEVLDAIDRSQWTDLCEELGDLTLQILFYAQVASDEGHFSIADVLATLNQKLIRRHPHVFGEAASIAAGNAAMALEDSVQTPAHVLRNWDAIKKAEKSIAADNAPSMLASVPRTFPALLEAAKLGSGAAKVGFDWPDHEGVMDKLQEEITELDEAILTRDDDQQSAARIEEELGDLLFTVANLARHLKIDPEVALRTANAKFRSRFAHMEAAGSLASSAGPAELEDLWAQAKKSERAAQQK